MATQANLTRLDDQSLPGMWQTLTDMARIRHREPHPDKGALWACAPDNPERGDILKFRFYPTNLPIELSANVAAETIAGRAMPAFQPLGGGGIKFTLELLFHDGFMPIVDGKPQATLARTAKTWFDMYVGGHDGGGIAVPYVYTYFQLGHSNPVRVIIHSVKLNTEYFDKDDNPMMLTASLDLSVFEPVEYVSPFKPKAPAIVRTTSKPKPAAKNECPPVKCECVCPPLAGEPSNERTAEQVAKGSELTSNESNQAAPAPAPVRPKLTPEQQARQARSSIGKGVPPMMQRLGREAWRTSEPQPSALGAAYSRVSQASQRAAAAGPEAAAAKQAADYAQYNEMVRRSHNPNRRRR